MEKLRQKECVGDAGERGRAGTPLPAAARTESAPYHPLLTHYQHNCDF